MSGATGLDHFTLEVSAPDRVDAIYGRAVAHDARATRPRNVHGRRQVFLFDPDGHKIEIVSPVDSEDGDR